MGDSNEGEEVNTKKVLQATRNICKETAKSINRVCDSMDKTTDYLIKDREKAVISIKDLATSLKEDRRLQRETNEKLFHQFGNVSEAMVAQSLITSDQTKAISNVATSINKLATEFSEHRGKSEEREKSARQAQQFTRDSMHRMETKVEKIHAKTDKIDRNLSGIDTRVSIIESSRKEKSNYMDGAFTKILAVLTLLGAIGIGLGAIFSNSKPSHPPHESRRPIP